MTCSTTWNALPVASLERSARLGVVVPLANEEQTIDDFLMRVLDQLAAGDRLFLVLDHKSRDRTRQGIEQFAVRDARVRLVWAPENRCVVDAYFRGYREALVEDCDWILEMDGGLSHLPEEIPRFIAAMRTGVDFAAGSRFTAGGAYQGRFSRYLLSKGGGWLSRWLLHADMQDLTCGFECFTRRALSHVVNRGVRSRAHFFQTEIRIMLRDWSWVEVPITYSAPSGRVSASVVLEALRNLWALRRDLRNEFAGEGR